MFHFQEVIRKHNTTYPHKKTPTSTAMGAGSSIEHPSKNAVGATGNVAHQSGNHCSSSLSHLAAAQRSPTSRRPFYDFPDTSGDEANISEYSPHRVHRKRSSTSANSGEPRKKKLPGVACGPCRRLKKKCLHRSTSISPQRRALNTLAQNGLVSRTRRSPSNDSIREKLAPIASSITVASHFHPFINVDSTTEGSNPGLVVPCGSFPQDGLERHCTCREPDNGTMITCENAACERDWYHLKCVGLIEAPPAEEPWYCDTCWKKGNLPAPTDTSAVQRKRLFAGSPILSATPMRQRSLDSLFEGDLYDATPPPDTKPVVTGPEESSAPAGVLNDRERSSDSIVVSSPPISKRAVFSATRSVTSVATSVPPSEQSTDPPVLSPIPSTQPSIPIGTEFFFITAKEPQVRSIEWANGTLKNKNLAFVNDMACRLSRRRDTIEGFWCTLTTVKSGMTVYIPTGDERQFERMKADFKNLMLLSRKANRNANARFKVDLEPVWTGCELPEHIDTEDDSVEEDDAEIEDMM